MVFGFFSIPASTDPKDRATVGEEVECGHGFCHGDGIAFDQQRYAGGEANALGRRCNCRKRNKGIERVGVFLGEFGTAGVWSFSTDRYVGMFGQPERLESTLFRFSSNVDDVVAVFRRKIKNANVRHGCLCRSFSTRLPELNKAW